MAFDLYGAGQFGAALPPAAFSPDAVQDEYGNIYPSQAVLDAELARREESEYQLASFLELVAPALVATLFPPASPAATIGRTFNKLNTARQLANGLNELEPVSSTVRPIEPGVQGGFNIPRNTEPWMYTVDTPTNFDPATVNLNYRFVPRIPSGDIKFTKRGAVDRRSGSTAVPGTGQSLTEFDQYAINNMPPLERAQYESWFYNNPSFIKTNSPAQRRDAWDKYFAESIRRINGGRTHYVEGESLHPLGEAYLHAGQPIPTNAAFYDPIVGQKYLPVDDFLSWLRMVRTTQNAGAPATDRVGRYILSDYGKNHMLTNDMRILEDVAHAGDALLDHPFFR